MEDFITAIQAALSVDSLWAQFAVLAPFLGGVAIFAFGFGLTRRAIKGASRGKVK